MFSKILIAGLAALGHSGLARADDHVSCEWTADASLCTAAVDSPEGEKYSLFQLQLALCAGFASLAGCTEDLPGMCKTVIVTGLGTSVCLPELSPDEISPQDTLKLSDIQQCVGDPSPPCNDIRTNFYEVLGCPECSGPANEAVPFERDCINAKTAAACAAASPDETGAPKNATGPDAAPAPAPAPTPAPAPADAPEEIPATGAGTEDSAAEGAADGTAVQEEASAAYAAVGTGAIALLAAAAAILI